MKLMYYKMIALKFNALAASPRELSSYGVRL